ncbi:protein immune deficiency [Topomyia yanbarensis]|uniref:protein immune deficiency n=1 Tax=Topomyia yanbarensis TaxID=2498891 RepID=UPI00273B1F8F|nr:protein immune deficiency [Topomyia yanbarensis]
MGKFKNIFVNLFPKTSSKLETDAVIIPRRSNTVSSESDKIDVLNNEHTGPGNTAVENSAIVPTSSDSLVAVNLDAPEQQLELANPSAGALTQNIVNNVQNNTLAAPQTSITNTAGIQVYQIKNAQNVHIGTSFTFHTGEDRIKPTNTSGNVKWANLKLSDTIKQMMDCKEDLDTGMMDTISRHMGYEWKSFARTLQYSDGQIEAFECDHSTLAEQIYHFVLDWIRNDDEPTLGRMVKLLWEHKHKETVYYMKLLWKKRNRKTPD